MAADVADINTPLRQSDTAGSAHNCLPVSPESDTLISGGAAGNIFTLLCISGRVLVS